MTNQSKNTATFKWLDENGEPYCPGQKECGMKCSEECPIQANYLGRELGEAGKMEEAKELFKKAIDNTPDYKYGVAWTNLATVYNRLGWARDAFEAFKNAYCINQGNARAYEGLAASYASLENYDKALEWCDKYAARFGENGIAKLRAKIMKKQTMSC